MDTVWLEDFLSLARTRNFSKSAEERNITQPAFSRRIRALERWLGVALFDRRTYPATLTPEGRAFRETAETVLSDLLRDRAQFRQAAHVVRPDLRIAAAATLNMTFIPGWLKALEPQTGVLTSHLITRRFNDMVQLLAEGEVDIVLQYRHEKVPVLFEQSLFETLTLGEDAMILVSPADPGSGRPLLAPPWRSAAVPYMGYSSDGYFAEVEKLVFARNNIQPGTFRRIAESPNSEILMRMAIAREALAFVPESCARAEIAAGVLAPVGGVEWRAALKIEVHRVRTSCRPPVVKLWQALLAAQAAEG